MATNIRHARGGRRQSKNMNNSFEKNETANHIKEAKVYKDVDEEPPKPVSSDSGEEESACDEASFGQPSSPVVAQQRHRKPSANSSLFAPYRSIGIVACGQPFHLTPHENSASAMVCQPLGNRFHIMQCDKLRPILVSQPVPGTSKESQKITRLVSDSSMEITVVAHGAQNNNCRHLTLYGRTSPVHTVPLTLSKQWTTVDLLHLGKLKVEMGGEKKGQKENVAVIAAILTKTKCDNNENEKGQKGLTVVGSYDEDSDDTSSPSESSKDSDGEEPEDDETQSNCCCQVVVLLASRTNLRFQKRISAGNLPTFYPQVAVHPSTYLNKIVIGGESQGRPAMFLLNLKSGKIVHTFSCLPKKENGKVTALEQSPAVDIIAVGTSQGKVHLVNILLDQTCFSLSHKARDGKTVVRINSVSFRTDGSAANYAIAPMAVGRSDGSITVWDLNPSEEGNDNFTIIEGRRMLCEMRKVHLGGVCQLTYLPQEPLLLSTGTSSNAVLMHIFDNPDHSGRILRQRSGHTSPPTKIRYLHPGAGAGSGILANAADGTDASSCQILSSGAEDRSFRVFSTARTVLDKEYSQGAGLKKRARKYGMESEIELLLPPLTGMALSEARSREWGDLVTIHRDHAFAYVWSTKRGAQSGPVLRQPFWNISAMKVPPPRSAQAVSVTISSCGNFALVGTRGGVIYKYNIQSGIPRGSYPRDAAVELEQEHKKSLREPGNVKKTMKALERKMKISNRASNLDKKDRDAVEEARVKQRKQTILRQASHTGAAVTGIAMDSVNRTVISVGRDAKLILWNFTTHAPHKKCPYKLPLPATMLCHVKDSDLAAIALDDYTSLLFDCTTLSIIRRFGLGAERHTAPISDLGFGPDGRSLFTSSLDCTIRVWDVPTNSCVDWLTFQTPPTSLTLSPTGEYLATTHVGQLDINIWCDRSFYQTVHVDGSRRLQEPTQMDAPVPLAEAWESATDSTQRLHDNDTDNPEHLELNNNKESQKKEAVPIQDGLITLSSLPPAHWKNLFHLELVKERNKPKEPPKKPPSAPFFLQWRPGESITGNKIDSAEMKDSDKQKDEEEWAAAWSDEEENKNVKFTSVEFIEESGKKRDRGSLIEGKTKSDVGKRKKISHYRSHLAGLLYECSNNVDSGYRFQSVTDHIASLGPSAIDVSLSTLCNGMHDLDDGLPLLQLACLWLLEACKSRERYEAVNAYLHRFLHIHSAVIAGIDDSSFHFDETDASKEDTRERMVQRQELLKSISALKRAQESALKALQGKMQHSLCLLRHFSRMV